MHPAWLALLNWFIERQGESGCIAPAKPAVRTVPSRQAGTPYRPSRADVKIHRQQWLTHKAAHPDAGRTALRRGLYAVWAWLYRNDRAWLRCHQPSNATRRGGRRSSKLEALLAPYVRVPVVPRQDRRGLLHLGTAYQVRVRLGVTDYAYGRLSAVDAGVSQQCISRVELAQARVASLQDALELDPHAAALSVLARRVSLRESTLKYALHAGGREEEAR
ncbi:TnsD family Tn7-like transposition protein [Ralstonia sp. R-29]|uniref:TnsD family Tn7-like transposition protein n=1 Tax=Ralstonia sp. R-29 TaxID=3404059 RepID=UPI003CE75179